VHVRIPGLLPPSRRPIILTLVAAFAATILSCYPGSTPTVEEVDVVVTLFNKDAKFGTYKTWSMVDSVFHLTDETEDLCEDRGFDNLVLKTINDNMLALGYDRLDTALADSADVLLITSVTCSKTVVIGIRPPYWGWYPGWGCCYGPGWGPGYPPGYVAGSYSTGTVQIEMYDPDMADPVLEIAPAAWVGALNGLLSSNTQGSATRIERGIDQAYEQSPYLKPNN